MTGTALNGGTGLTLINGSRVDETVCRGCGYGLSDDEPVVYEFIADGMVDAVVVSTDEALRLPHGAAFVDTFHPACFEKLVSCWGANGNGHWVGRCSLSQHRISAPHRLEECPICGEATVD